MIERIYGVETKFSKLVEPLYDYSALENLTEFKALTDPAKFIGAVDLSENRVCMLWGTAYFRAIVDKAIPPQLITEEDFIIFGVRSIEELGRLNLAVAVSKGFSEFGE